MQTQIVETLRLHGLDIDGNETDSKNLAYQLTGMDVKNLWTIVEDLAHEEINEIDGNEQIQGMALNYALVDAFENDLDQITQKEIDVAVEKATESVNNLSGNQSEVSSPGKPNRKTLIKNLVEENPDALADEIIDMALEANDNMNKLTAKQYYYNVRKELGLEPVGKRGRKPSDTIDRIKALLDGNLDVPKSEMVEKIVSEIGVKEGTASTYYSKAKKQLKQGESA